MANDDECRLSPPVIFPDSGNWRPYAYFHMLSIN